MGKVADFPKRRVLSFRVTDGEMDEIVMAAGKAGQRMGDFLYAKVFIGLAEDDLLSSLVEGFKVSKRS